MSGNGKKRPPLVADRRYPKKTAARQPRATKPKAPSSEHKAATATSPSGGRARSSQPKPKAAQAAARRRAGGGRRRNFLVSALIGLLRWSTVLLWRLIWRGAAVTAIIVGLAVMYTYTTLPPMNDLLDARVRGSVTLLDRNGEVFAWRGEQFGGQITADTVSPHLKNAIIATEDRRFYQHFGISPRGIASAIRINLEAGRGPLSGNGGSTITQQTAKLLCIGVKFDPAKWESEAAYEADCRESSLWRKAKEAVYALAMEAKYSKDEILTIYLNRAYLGAGTRGFEAASQRYFGKSANQVSPAEAAMLAGLLKAPSKYAPTSNLQRSRDRANLIIGLMEEQGYLTPQEAEEARTNPAELSEAAEARAGGYFADWVMESGPSFFTRATTEDVIIRTTFDPKIQTAAEEALQKVIEERLGEDSEVQAAIVVMSADGAVRAMVGGRKLKGVAGQFNRAIQARRQTGSAFKPFVYAAALDLGYRYDDVVMDAPITIDIPGSGPWSPKNYTGKFKGPVTLTYAMKYSLNTPAVRVTETVGRDAVRQVATGFGLNPEFLADGPAIALGASESTLLEMTSAYAGILNGGSSVRPYGLLELRIQGDEEPLMGQAGGIGERVVTTNTTRQLIYMMNQVVEGGTAKRAQLPGREVAAKTGTTQGARDAWFLGFTADYVAGVWMGNDDNSPTANRLTGGSLPAEIWRETMLKVHEGLPPKPLPMIRPAEPPVVRLTAEQAAALEAGGEEFGILTNEQLAMLFAPPEETSQRRRGGNVAEQILQDVLGGIFGQRNR